MTTVAACHCRTGTGRCRRLRPEQRISDHAARATAQHGALLIADEVQSGMGRCGQFFGVQVHGIEPDMLTSAKALGGGFACGAVLCSNSVGAHFGAGDLGTTFGGGPVAAAAIVAVIESIESENLLANVRAARSADT